MLKERFEESFSSLSGVVDELKYREVDRRCFLGESAMGPQPGSQQGPKTFPRVDRHFVKSIAVVVAGRLLLAVIDGVVFVAPVLQPRSFSRESMSYSSVKTVVPS